MSTRLPFAGRVAAWLRPAARRLLPLLAPGTVAVFPLAAQEPSAALARPGLRMYVQEVFAQNAGLRASRDAQSAAIERVPPAGALPDPMVMLGAISIPIPSFDFDAEPMTQVPVGLQQRFPFPGKQRAATASARADSAVAGTVVVAFEAELATNAARAYYRYAEASTALSVWQERVALANRTVEVTQSRYATGAVPQTDLLRARLRRAELEAERRRLEAGLTGALAQLNALREAADPLCLRCRWWTRPELRL